RDGADNVVDLELVEQRHGEDDDDATNSTDERGCAEARGERLGSDGDETGKRAVDDEGEVDLLVDDSRADGGGEGTTGSSGIGVGHDATDVSNVTDSAHGELGGTVKAVPTHPEDEHAEDGKRHIGARDGARRAIRIVFAATGAEHDGAGKS